MADPDRCRQLRNGDEPFFNIHPKLPVHVFNPIGRDEAIQITGPDGEVILTFEASTTAQSLVFSSPELVNGSAYTITTGGTVSGDSATGIYEEPSFSGGSSTVEVSATTESSGGQMGGMPSGGFAK